MCGILGALPPADPKQFKHALNTIMHRGPDNEGIWEDPGYITLGHRRLAILDLTPEGHQPMISHNGRYVLVFNGEIYNFIELGNELKKTGFDHVIIKGKSDKPVYLSIENENVEIKDAIELWGKGTRETEDLIKIKLGDNSIKITSIGPAGENLVKFASIMNEKGHAAGRCFTSHCSRNLWFAFTNPFGGSTYSFGGAGAGASSSRSSSAMSSSVPGSDS